MKKRNYIFVLATMLLGTACSQEEFTPTTEQGDEDILFTATLQKEIAAESRALGDNNKEEVALPYVNNIRVRKVDINSGETIKPTETQIFKVRTGNYGTLDMVDGEGKPSGTAMKWTDKAKEVDFYAWTVPTGVSIENDATTGTVDFAAGNKYDAQSANPSDKLADVVVAPLEAFIGAYNSGKYTEDPSVSLPFKHLVSKVKIMVHWYDTSVITDQVTITFPYINKVWEIAQNQESGSQSVFAISIPNNDTKEALTLTMTNLAKNSNGRYFYLPPLTGNYNFAKAGDFEISYNSKTYYGSLADIRINNGQLAAGEYMVLTIDLNENFNAGAGATIEPWSNVNDLEVQANPYRGIYTLEGLKVLKNNIDNLPDSLYMDGTGDLSGKKIIRLYNDLTLTDEEWSLVLEDNMIFDGLGHIVNVPNGKSLFGEVSATANKEIAINNIRLTGAGQLATSLTNVSVYNCHANGTGNLVGTAKGTTEFNFCSAENSTDNSTGSSITLMGSFEGSGVTVKNSFVASSATGFVSNGTITAKNSFIINTSENTYWNTKANGTQFTIDADNVTATTVAIDNVTTKLIDLLNAGSEGTNNQWAYVYGKNYPVMRIK